jgi:TonB dependent receptor/CarboxypepD_reg-like domain/TonB-dependent Receptor Plug Domain
MTKLKPIFYFFSLLISTSTFAQKFTISGTIRDKATGEELIGAVVVIKDLPNTGMAANEYGFYSISLPQGKYNVKVSFTGYKAETKQIDLTKNQKLDWGLENGTELQEIVVKAQKDDENLTTTTMGSTKLDVKEISKIPVIFGEKDVLKTLQLLPGIKSAGEGNSGFYVRGGGSDQNLILLDEAPVYNASHLLGFFSTFNSDAIKDATIIKGNAPAQYGGRLSSVLDVRMREGNDKNYNVSGGIGLISSRLSVEGPIQQDKSSFMITGRRTYADLFLKASPDFADNTLYFYDLNAKANYRINENNRIFVSGYFGRDQLGFGENVGIDWGNKTGTLRWNSILNAKLFSNTSLIYSDYSYEFNISANDNNFINRSQIKDWNLKQEFQFFPSTRSSWKFGLNTIQHTIYPGSFVNKNATDGNAAKESRLAWENAIYANNVLAISPKFSIDYGLRLTSWSIIGKGTYNIYDRGVKTDEVKLESGEFGKTYFNFEPRLSFNLTLDENSSFKSGYARNTQNLHLLSNSTGSNPTDQWIGTSYNIKPEIADQVSLGYFRNFKDNQYEFSAEGYYKALQNQLDYKNSADINTAPDVESELLYGKGRAYGLELFLKKKTGRFTGWLSYTLSRTERLIDGINNGNWYAAKQDRTHDISLVGMYQLTPKWSLASNFIYYTGNAVTFSTGKYSAGGNTTFLYGDRNANRMPAYHRLDISATYEKPRKGRFQSSWNFSIYNLYGRENAYTITFEDDPKDASRTRAIQTSLFRWVPSVTYNFKF